MVHRHLLAPVIAFAVLPGTAPAATIEVTGFASVAPGFGYPQSAPASDDDYVLQETTYASIRGRAAQLVPQTPTSSSFLSPGWFSEADYDANADATTGQMRFLLNGYYQAFCTNVAPSQCVTGSYWANALTSVTESFRVTGTGVLRAVMQVDAFWDAPNYGFVSDVRLYGGSLFDTDNLSYATGGGGDTQDGRFVNRLLTAEVALVDAVDLDLTASWFMNGGISAIGGFDGPRSRGYLNASNTATFFLEAGEGLTISGTSSGFLSQPAYLDPVTAVPLPAGLSLLLTSLATLAGLGARRRARAAA